MSDKKHLDIDTAIEIFEVMSAKELKKKEKEMEYIKIQLSICEKRIKEIKEKMEHLKDNRDNVQHIINAWRNKDYDIRDKYNDFVMYLVNYNWKYNSIV